MSKKIVLCSGVRTPIGHIARSLAKVHPEQMLADTIKELVSRSKVDPEQISGVIMGWVGQSFSAPNIARVAALKAGLPLKIQSMTVQNNCVSSIESVANAARFILAGDGDLYIAGGVESMSQFPYTLTGDRSMRQLRSLDQVKKKWGSILQDPEVSVIDSMEEGLTDPVKEINMAGTAELCAQKYGIPQTAQDEYAHGSYKKAIDGWNAGAYADWVMPKYQELDKDEYPFLREDLVAKPEKFAKAPKAFDNSSYSIKDFFAEYGHHFTNGTKYEEGKSVGTVTLFNSCARSDGAAAIIVATEEKAKALGLQIVAELKSWGFYGNDPAFMGVAPALATDVALARANMKFDELGTLEVHEPFAATVLSIFKVGKDKFGHDWQAKQDAGLINPHGGSIAIGHPLGATGTRLILNALSAFQRNPKAQTALLTACAGGGMGGAMILERRL